MATHSFSFDGGDILSKMGATWFVSYLYYRRMDTSHRNWSRVSTATSRISKYNASSAFHKEWLQEVLLMNPQKLNTNTIGLDAGQVKAMAQELLSGF
ncbi:MAG: hypothetical protein RRY64_08360 [Oscillospiraceae bacterium]